MVGHHACRWQPFPCSSCCTCCAPSQSIPFSPASSPSPTSHTTSHLPPSCTHRRHSCTALSSPITESPPLPLRAPCLSPRATALPLPPPLPARDSKAGKKGQSADSCVPCPSLPPPIPARGRQSQGRRREHVEWLRIHVPCAFCHPCLHVTAEHGKHIRWLRICVPCLLPSLLAFAR